MLALALALACGGSEEPPPVLTSRPSGQQSSGVKQVSATEVTLEGGRAPLHPTAWTAEHLGWPQLDTLSDPQAGALMGALNQLGAPCDPCWQLGQSYSTCLRERPEACVGVLGTLLDRGVRLAAAGSQTADIRAALTYDDVWVDLDRPGLDAVASGWGPAEAPVALVLVVDLQSPFCARVSDSWQTLLDVGADDLRVRVLYWTEERHPRSGPAALAAEAAAAQGRQWDYTRRLLSDYHHLEDTDLVAAATELGLDLAAFDQVRRDPATAERLAAQRAFAEALGVRTAPTAFVQGFRQRGARPHAQLASLYEWARSDRAP